MNEQKPNYSIEAIAGQHDREQFNCGEKSLDDYLRAYAGQNARKGISKTFVLLCPPSDRVLGYYSLCSGSVEFDDFPESVRKGVPHYPIPTAHLGRLAVDVSVQGQGFGKVLLWDALARILHASEDMGILAVTVRALHDKAKRFYLKYGFEPLTNDDQHLYILLETVRKVSQ